MKARRAIIVYACGYKARTSNAVDAADFRRWKLVYNIEKKPGYCKKCQKWETLTVYLPRRSPQLKLPF